ncbi:hypothetical protein EVAR_99938_1 [Eumeta japonica]|uniref:Uncharacterized protein n=1 Tax=Eumeta variegata TaxID=151549 RepID=A0A4C1Z0Z5_EUMVA|nr:hypothetical protein EVAR_99938_1 [Eumeta japonica]
MVSCTVRAASHAINSATCAEIQPIALALQLGSLPTVPIEQTGVDNVQEYYKRVLRDPSHNFDSDPIFTLVFDPSSILNSGSGGDRNGKKDWNWNQKGVFDSNSGPIFASALCLAFNFNSAIDHSSDFQKTGANRHFTFRPRAHPPRRLIRAGVPQGSTSAVLRVHKRYTATVVVWRPTALFADDTALFTEVGIGAPDLPSSLQKAIDELGQ